MSKGYSGLFKFTKGDRENFEIKYESSNKGNRKEPDFYIGPNKKALKAEHKKWIGVSRRDRLLKKAKDPELKKAIDQLYRPKSFIGDGGTASVLKFEHATSLGLGKEGKTHEIKAINAIRHLNNRVLTNENLSLSDKKIATKLKNQLIRALGGYKNGK